VSRYGRGMDLYDVMRTTFACRDWTDEPVSHETVHRILDNARFAPNGGNRQGWHVIVLDDKETRRRLIPLIEPTTSIYAAQTMAGESPWNSITPSSVDPAEAAAAGHSFPGLDKMVDAPVVLVITVDLSLVASFDKELDRVGVISGASIYPFVWNILLSARNEGLGGVLTTYLAGQEPEVQKVLGIPSHHAVAAMVPLGVPVKQLTKLRRAEVSEFTTIDSFDGSTFESPASGE
jgi:nitroreductase